MSCYFPRSCSTLVCRALLAVALQVQDATADAGMVFQVRIYIVRKQTSCGANDF